MGVIEILLLGLALSADAFAVTVSNSFAYAHESRARLALMPVFFGAFQALMPLLGYFLGGLAAELIERYSGIVTMVILGIIGANMVREGVQALRASKAEGSADPADASDPAGDSDPADAAAGEKSPKRLTLAYDSISYDPATHIVYLPQSLKSGSVCIYSAEGELVKRIPVSPTVNIVPLPDAELRRGAIYIVKYLPEDTMSRKGPWIKILFK